MSHLIKTWNNRSIRIRPKSRYVSLTDMANATGKRFPDWYRLQGTQSYLDTLAAVVQIPTTELIRTIQGGIPELQGSWGHPKVALRFAQWCSDEFAVQVDCWVDELLTTGSVQLHQKQPQVPYFYQRLQLFHERTGRIPEGYFCIFEETISLISRLECYGYNIPDDARLDASIGKCFCKYLRDEHGIEPDDYCLKYPHWFPGQMHPVKANLYPVEWLSTFRKWLESRYYRYQLSKYFKTRKDAKAIEAVNRFLGLLPGS